MLTTALRILAQHHLTGRPIRTTITVVGIALGVSVSVAIRTANVEVLRSFEEAVTSVAGQATLQITAGDLGFDERLIVPVRRHPDVAAALPVLAIGGTVASGPQAEQTVRILALDLLEAAEFKEFRVEIPGDEERFVDRLLRPTTLFVGKRLAEKWNLEPGRELDLFVGTARRQVTVEGVITATTDLSSAWEHLAVMDIAAAQELFGLVGRLDRIDVVTGTERSVEEVAADLRDLLPATVTVARPSHRSRQVERMVRAFQLNLTTLSAVGLLVGLLLVYNTVSYAVVQRRREIGVFRAIGMPRGGVMTLFIAEGALMGLVGGVVGGWLGAMYSTRIVGMLRRSVSELYAQVPPGAGPMGADLDSILLQSAVLGMGVSIIGALAPSLEASRTQPARALAPGQYEDAQEDRAGRLAVAGGVMLVLALAMALPGPVGDLPLFGYASALSLLLGLSFLAPLFLRAFGASAGLERGRLTPGMMSAALGRLAADQIGRSPGRNGVTVSALMVGVAIMVGVGIMVQSFRQTVEDWIQQTIIADLIVAPAAWPVGDEGAGQGYRIPLSVAGAVATVPGVAAVDIYRNMRIEVGGRTVSLVARDLEVHATWSRYLFFEGASAAVLEQTRAREGVVVSEVFARNAGVGVGEEVTLKTPQGLRAFPVMGVFYDYATDGGKVVMDHGLFRRLWDDPSTSVIPVYLHPGADLETVRRDIEGSVGRQGELAILRNADIKEEILAIFDRTFTVTYALELIAVTIALLGIANTVLTSVLERQREIATMRAIGASAPQIKRLVLWETSYLGLIGGLLGVVAGVLLAILLIEVINRQSFGWTIRFLFPPRLVLEAMAVALVAAVAAGYLPAVWAARQPISEGLRYE